MNLKANNKKLVTKEIVENLKIDGDIKYENKEERNLFE